MCLYDYLFFILFIVHYRGDGWYIMNVLTKTLKRIMLIHSSCIALYGPTMIKYMVIHCKHEGCYDFHCYEDEQAKIRFTSIRINPPKVFLFRTRDEAQDFFEDYINDIDCTDLRCRKGEDIEHVELCTCGVIDFDDKDEPVLFYDKKNQVFLMEQGPDFFVPNYEVKSNTKNLNLTNRLIRRCKTLSTEQRNRYIELGKYCQECNEEENLTQIPLDNSPSSATASLTKEEEEHMNEIMTGQKPFLSIPITLPSNQTGDTAQDKINERLANISQLTGLNVSLEKETGATYSGDEMCIPCLEDTTNVNKWVNSKPSATKPKAPRKPRNSKKITPPT